MWKYSTWKKWSKIVFTAYFSIGIITILFTSPNFSNFTVYGPLNALAVFFPLPIDKSNTFDCKPLDTEWGKCTNLQKHFSFEYPLSWHYADSIADGIAFDPNSKNITNQSALITLHPFGWDNETSAKAWATILVGNGGHLLNTNGLYGSVKYDNSRGYYDFDAHIFWQGGMTYQFLTLKKQSDVLLSETYLKNDFEHMVNSFRVEQ